MFDHVILHALVFALLLTVVEAAQAQVPSDTSEQGQWGIWGAAASCPAGQYVWGFRLKSEPYQGNGDDTALNAIQLICKSGATGQATYIQSLEGKWGSWGKDHVCREHPVIGFAIQVERFQGRDKEKGSKDDTAAGNIKMNCGSQILVGDPPNAWGEWTGFYSCLDGTGAKKVKGFRTRVEPDQGSGDDTALNAMQVYCGF
ncbi:MULTISPECIES: hypothetical protein [Pseudomonas]|jgi:hypothetical protein|uniref:hypothetical protein n=1 Tax=Pseudomonas TaxID=286 RepID=UPI000E31ADBA|nr:MULTISPECIES: hypothetical protein [Pseudomonas]AXP04684.1 hypothetical protein DZG01_17570 [Pseudomonas fluorescens]MCD9119157.1 hypothetical protein [Pseudomonas bijieensis]UQI29765.1 hypothetical protein M3M50_22880 [Pseudomonas bijieensis]WLH61513.1 hypothetical protein PSH86_22720 [Pseudomonas sp. FP2300]